MVFWVTRATEDFVCNTFRAMTMANFHLTKKPTLPGIWTAWGSCSWTMMIMMKTMSMKSRSHCPMEKRVIHMWGRVMRTSRKSITPELNCYSCVIIFFLFPFFPFCLSQMLSYTICIPTPIAGGKQRETKREREFPSAVQLRILHALNLYFFTGCDNSDRDKQLKQVFKNAQSVKKTWATQTWATWGSVISCYISNVIQVTS